MIAKYDDDDIMIKHIFLAPVFVFCPDYAPNSFPVF